jgi:putative membrane protein
MACLSGQVFFIGGSILINLLISLDFIRDATPAKIPPNFPIFELNQKKTIMNLIIRILLTAVSVMIIARFLPGVTVDGFATSIIVAIVLALLNLIVKPILIILTLPVTIITLGLFLLVINAVIIILCAKIVDGFHVDGFLTALFFSIILSILQSIMYSLTNNSNSRN